MKETIILAPGCNGTELIRTLARFGINTLGLRIENAVSLSRMALMRSGIAVCETFLPANEEAAIYNTFLCDIPYYSSASYSDAENMARAIFLMRSLIVENESDEVNEKLQRGEFKEKNCAIVEIYDRYTSELSRRGCIDSIGVIRKAVNEAKPMDADFIILEEYPLSPIEEAILRKLSNENYRTVSLSDMFGKEVKLPSHINMSKCYGALNEIENIIGYIYKNNIPLDQCVVAVCDEQSYSQLLYDYSLQYDIPVAFGTGIPIMNTNPAVLLQLLKDWSTSGYYGVDALKNILKSEAFDRSKVDFDNLEDIAVMAGQLRLSYDGVTNHKRVDEYRQIVENLPEVTEKEKQSKEKTLKTLADTEKLAELLSLGCSSIIEHYSYIRFGFAGRADRSAANIICSKISAFERLFDGDDPAEIAADILSGLVCQEISREGELFVTGIHGAKAALRPYVFIAGLSASDFPGSPTENYIMLDSDYQLFGHEDKAPTSENIINNNKKKLYDLLNISGSLGVQVQLSYSDYSLSELKSDNPSSVMFDIYSSMNEGADMKQFDADLEKVGFFSQPLSGITGIGQAYNRGCLVEKSMDEPADEAILADLERSYSPSAIDIFFSCPARFYYKYVLGIKEPTEDDPFQVINAAALGTLAHSQMERLAGIPMSREEFLQKAEAEFEDFLKSRPPVHESAVEKEKKDFLKMMENAYDSNPGFKVVSAEEEWTVQHESGVNLKGYPDRIEKCPDNSCIIADYKTKRKIEHVEDDVDTCMQILIYAYMAEKNGFPVKGGEYRYIRLNQNITCRYDDSMKEELARKLHYFRSSLENAEYPCVEDEKACKYCGFKSVCGKEGK